MLIPRSLLEKLKYLAVVVGEHQGHFPRGSWGCRQFLCRRIFFPPFPQSPTNFFCSRFGCLTPTAVPMSSWSISCAGSRQQRLQQWTCPACGVPTKTFLLHFCFFFPPKALQHKFTVLFCWLLSKGSLGERRTVGGRYSLMMRMMMTRSTTSCGSGRKGRSTARVVC